jgi:hypothetical protein
MVDTIPGKRPCERAAPPNYVQTPYVHVATKLHNTHVYGTPRGACTHAHVWHGRWAAVHMAVHADAAQAPPMQTAQLCRRV